MINYILKIDFSLGEAESLNAIHTVVPENIENRSRKVFILKLLSWSDRNILLILFAILQPDYSSIDKAVKLIGCKINFYNEYVEVIAVKATKDGIFLDVKENMGEELIHYEIDYEDDMVPLWLFYFYSYLYLLLS